MITSNISLKISKKYKVLLLLLILIILSSLIFIHQKADAAINEVINIQGKLVDSDGTNFSGACGSSCDFQVKIYDASSAGNELYSESHSNVTVSDGIFNIKLGSVTSLDNDADLTGFDRDDLYIQVELDADDNGSYEEVFSSTSRPQLTSVPYALNAKYVGGVSSSGFIHLSPSSAQTTGDVSTSLIHLNENGSSFPNLLELEVAGSDIFTIANGGDITTTGNTTIADAKWVGLGNSAGRIVFEDDTTDYINLLDANVGIGTTSPERKLEIDSGRIRLSGDPVIEFYYSSAIKAYLQYNVGTDVMSLYHSDTGGSQLNLLANGNVGIGTTNPGATLNVVANNAEASIETYNLNGSGWAGLEMQNSSASWKTFLGYSNSGDHFRINVNNIPLYLLQSGSEKFTLATSGNIGIGTTSPISILDIDPGSAGTTSIGGRSISLGVRTVVTSGRSGFTVQVGNNYTAADDNAAFQFLYPFDTGGNAGYKPIRIATGSTLSDVFYVRQDGQGYFASNIGIGRTGPTQLLEVSAATTGQILLSDSNDSYNERVTIGTGSDGGFLRIRDDEENQNVLIRGYSNGGIQAFFNAGNVGIGTTGAASKLHVIERGQTVAYTPSGTSTKGIIIDSGLSSGSGSYAHLGLTIYGDADDYSFIHGIHNSAILTELAIGTNSTEAIRIDGSGNIGIGTTNPGTVLAVAGLTGTSSGSYLRVYNNNIYYYSSSRANKTNIKNYSDNFYKILQAQPRIFNDKATGERLIGYIAEEFEDLDLNNLVTYGADGKIKGLAYEKVPIYNLEIIKDHEQKIIELTNSSLSEDYINKLDQIISYYDDVLLGDTGSLDSVSNLTITDTLNANIILADNVSFNSIEVDDITVNNNLNVSGLLTSHQIRTEKLYALSNKNIILQLSESFGDTAFEIQNSEGEVVFSVDSDGKLSFSSDKEDSSVGTSSFGIGETEITIETSVVTPDSKVFVTPKAEDNNVPIIGVKEIGDGYFIIKMDQTHYNKTEFDWWVIN